MNGAIGQLLPAAMTIFISPLPITALLLLLLSRHGLAPALAYASGWVLGIGLEVACFTVIGGVALSHSSAQTVAVVAGVVDLLVALTMFALAFVAWHGRPRPGRPPAPPRWLATVDGMSPWGALGLALVFAIFSPVNLSVAAEAGATIASAGLGAAGMAALALAFVLVGTSSVTGPVLVFAIGRDRVRSAFDSLRAWLLEHNSTVLTVLLLVIGTDFLGQAIGALWT